MVPAAQERRDPEISRNEADVADVNAERIDYRHTRLTRSRASVPIAVVSIAVVVRFVSPSTTATVGSGMPAAAVRYFGLKGSHQGEDRLGRRGRQRPSAAARSEAC